MGKQALRFVPEELNQSLKYSTNINSRCFLKHLVEREEETSAKN
jgi:hypothetical protein